MDAPLLLVASGLFIVGLAGALTRRSLIVTLASTQLSLSGGVVAFVHYALVRGEATGLSSAILLLILGGCTAVPGAAMAIAIYRRRGTLNLDELRELRG